MAHFAELDENNVVIQVIVVDNNDCLDENGQESEAKGIEFCQNLLGGNKWIQTSYNHTFRGIYAGIGYHYDEVNDIFVDVNRPIESEVVEPTGEMSEELKAALGI